MSEWLSGNIIAKRKKKTKGKNKDEKGGKSKLWIWHVSISLKAIFKPFWCSKFLIDLILHFEQDTEIFFLNEFFIINFL
jgi:hypothetical protein